MSLKNKLHRLKSHINLPEKTTAKKNVQRNTNDIPYIEMWRDAGAVPYFASDDEYCFIREKRYPLHYQHGKYPFQQLLAAIEGWNDFSGVHPLSAKRFSTR